LSCQIVVFEARTLDAQLDAVCEYFFAMHATVDGGGVVLPRLLSWYRDDFGGEGEAILAFVVQRSAQARQKAMRRALEAHGGRGVKFGEFQWAFCVAIAGLE
jgi:hypothetical protein